MSSLLKHVLTAFALVIISLGAAGRSQATQLVLTVTNSAQTASQSAMLTFSGTTNRESQPATFRAIELRDTFPASTGSFVHPAPALTTESGNEVTFAILKDDAPGLYPMNIRLASHFPGGKPNEYSHSLPYPIKGGAEVSEPVTMILLGTGLLGVAKVRSRRTKLCSQD